MDLTAAAHALESSALGAWVRGSPVAYPVANLVHLLGLVLLIGGIGIVDLRLIGLGRRIPLMPIARFLTPLAIAGLMLLLASGFLLFAADAGPLIRSAAFRWKMVLLALALINAILFQLLWRRKVGGWSRGVPSPARAMAGLSLGLWLAIATFGRLIAYN